MSSDVFNMLHVNTLSQNVTRHPRMSCWTIILHSLGPAVYIFQAELFLGISMFVHHETIYCAWSSRINEHTTRRSFCLHVKRAFSWLTDPQYYSYSWTNLLSHCNLFNKRSHAQMTAFLAECSSCILDGHSLMRESVTMIQAHQSVCRKMYCNCFFSSGIQSIWATSRQARPHRVPLTPEMCIFVYRFSHTRLRLGLSWVWHGPLCNTMLYKCHAMELRASNLCAPDFRIWACLHEV